GRFAAGAAPGPRASLAQGRWGGETATTHIRSEAGLSSYGQAELGGRRRGHRDGDRRYRQGDAHEGAVRPDAFAPGGNECPTELEIRTCDVGRPTAARANPSDRQIPPQIGHLPSSLHSTARW